MGNTKIGNIRIGIIGTGWMARAIMQAISALRKEFPEIELSCVASRDQANYTQFSGEFGFKKALPLDQFWNEDFDHLFITTPCSSHFEYLQRGIAHDRISRIYCEKPLVASAAEAAALVLGSNKRIQVGFQFLQLTGARKARELALTLGKPIHFEAHYLKSNYMEKSYRDTRRERLLPAPVGGVTSDLASHALSLLVSFFGDTLAVQGSVQSGSFPDVDPRSDLHTQILLKDEKSLAVGSVTASRISRGHEDEIGFSIHFENGALRYSTSQLSTLMLFEKGSWREIEVSQQSKSEALVAALRHFFSEEPKVGSYVPDLNHGLRVQELILQSVANAGLPIGVQ